jgi:hypothetical protein
MTVRYYSSVAGEYSLTNPVTAASTTVTLNSGTGLPSSTPFTLLLDYSEVTEEIVTVTNVAGLNLTVTRGQDGTAAQSHSAGAVVRHAVTAQDFRDSRNHEESTAAHGSNGNLVGESNAQVLKNKTISGSSNTITNVPKSALPGDIVDTASTQTLTNKTVSAPNLTGSATDPILPFWTGAASGTNAVQTNMWERVAPLGAANNSHGNWQYANGQWAVPVSGIYHIDAGVGFISGPQTGQRRLHVLFNNSYSILTVGDWQSGADPVYLNGSRTLYLPAGTTLQFEMFQASGGWLDMSQADSSTYFSIHFVCPAS